MLHP
jgi:hypothetical protein